MFTRVYQRDLSMKCTKCIKRTGGLFGRLIAVNHASLSLWISRISLLNILFPEAIKVGEITIAATRVCTVIACATCCTRHAQQPPSLEFLFHTRTRVRSFLMKQYIYRTFTRAYSYARRVRAGNAPRFS